MYLESGDEGGETAEALLAGAADADEQGVAARSLDDAVDAQHVRDGIVKEHEVHGGIQLVVVVERLLQQLARLRVVAHRLVLEINQFNYQSIDLLPITTAACGLCVCVCVCDYPG